MRMRFTKKDLDALILEYNSKYEKQNIKFEVLGACGGYLGIIYENNNKYRLNNGLITARELANIIIRNY